MRTPRISIYTWLLFLFLAACSMNAPVATPPTPAIAPPLIAPTPAGTDGPQPPLVPITLANAEDVRLLKTLPIPEFAASSISQCSIDFSPDGAKLAGVCYKNTAPVWDVSSGRLLFSLAKSPSHIVAVSFSPDGKTIALGDYAGKIGLYDATTGELIGTFDPLASAVWELDYSPSGDRLTLASFRSGVHLWDIIDRKPLWNYGEKDMLRVLSVDYAPTGDAIACGTLSNGVMIVDSKTGQLIKHLPLSAPVGDVAFSPDGRWLAAGSDDNKIRLWRTSDYELGKTLEGHAGYVNGVAFSPDGRLLVSGSHDKQIGIWDIQSGQKKLLEGHQGVVLRVGMNSSGTLIASISWDGTVRLWGIGGIA